MSNRFATYPKMTESGDDLFCEIPASWDRLRIKQLFKIRKDIAGRLGYPVWSVTQHGLREKDITSGEGQLSMDYSKYQMLRVGDLVMNHMDLITGGIDIGWKEGVTSPDYRVFIPRLNAEVNKQYFVWLFRLCYWTKKFYSLGQGSAHLGRWRLPTRAFESIVVPVPSLPEQKQIAAFLDYETVKIDALIEKQQQLIDLLGEKRQAVISHAVTKGLNPDVPIRDSGIEWLGEIPKHWTASKLKHHVLQIVDGAHFTPTYVETGVPFVRVTDIQTFPIDQSAIKYIPKAEHKELVKRCSPKRGDLLLSKNGTIGVPRVVEWDWEFSIFVSLCLIKLKRSLDVRFLYYFFLTHQIREQIFGLIKQSTVINLHLDKIENFWLAIPPLIEQKEIVQSLDRNIGKYDVQIKLAEAMNRLLQERRTALISAAVTGKIDVRGWDPHSSGVKQEAQMGVA